MNFAGHVLSVLNQHVCIYTNYCTLKLGCRHTKMALHGDSLLPTIVPSSASFLGSHRPSVVFWDVSAAHFSLIESLGTLNHLRNCPWITGRVRPELRHVPALQTPLCLGPMLRQYWHIFLDSYHFLSVKAGISAFCPQTCPIETGFSLCPENWKPQSHMGYFTGKEKGRG